MNLGGSDDAKTLQPIHYTYNDLTSGVFREMVINPAGELHILETVGTDPNNTTRVGGPITIQERAALISAFRDWSKLDEAYPTDVSPQFQITYNGHSVITSSLEHVPSTFIQAKGVLDRIAAVMLKMGRDKKNDLDQRAKANSNASQPATPAADQSDPLPVPIPLSIH